MNRIELRQTLFRFREARALFAGHELGVFAALAQHSRTVGELAEQLEVDVDALRVLLRALVAMGVLVEPAGSAGGYALEPEAAEVLVDGGEESCAHLLSHDLWHWGSWARLDETIRTGEPLLDRSGDPHLGRHEILRAFLPNYVIAMEESGRESLPALAAEIAALAPKRFSDWGGGSGALSIEVLRRCPDTQGVLVDHAFCMERARQLLDAPQVAADVRARTRLHPADLEKDPLPSEQEVILLSRVLMGLSADRAAQLVQRAAACLAPGGVLVVHDFDAASRVGALLSLDMRRQCGGEVHTEECLWRCFEAAGLRPMESRPLTSYTRVWLATRAPAAPGTAEPAGGDLG